jgi:hypothetical protein
MGFLSNTVSEGLPPAVVAYLSPLVVGSDHALPSVAVGSGNTLSNTNFFGPPNVTPPPPAFDYIQLPPPSHNVVNMSLKYSIYKILGSYCFLESNVSFGLRIGQNCDTPKVDFVIAFLRSMRMNGAV